MSLTIVALTRHFEGQRFADTIVSRSERRHRKAPTETAATARVASDRGMRLHPDMPHVTGTIDPSARQGLGDAASVLWP